jgi:hypothetical protein
MNNHNQGYYPNQDANVHPMGQQPRMPPMMGFNPQVVPREQGQ